MLCKVREAKGSSEVTTYWCDGNKHARAFSAHRGGCLYCGYIIFKDLNTAPPRTATVQSTSCWDYQVGDTNAYLASLWEKHMGQSPVTGRECCPENGPCHDCER